MPLSREAPDAPDPWAEALAIAANPGRIQAPGRWVQG